jgi:predicted lipoprotein with Yx(FWY)xxD motif
MTRLSSHRMAATAVAATTLAGAALVAAGPLASASSAGAAATAARPAKSGLVEVMWAKRGKLGMILVTGSGMTLYRYTPDGTGKPTCTGGCASAWPPLLLPANQPAAKASAGVTGIGSVASHGHRQVTYHHMPLYTYAGDKAAGQVNGQGIGGVWFVIKK